MKNPRHLPRFLAVAIALAGLAASGSALANKDVVLAIGYQPETLDPYNTNTTITTAVTKSFYEGLFQFDKDLKVVPVLAEGYEVSKDGLVYTLKLRQGVKFHDGTDFNAEAVKFVLDRVMNPENKLLRANQFNRVSKVEAVNPSTVRITLKEPFAPFINTLAHGSAAMISPTALKKWGNKDIAFHPVGTGPFEFVEWKQTEAVKGKKFDGYWKKGYPNGFESVLWGAYANTTTNKVLQFMQQQLAQVGIKLQVQALEVGQRTEWVDAWPDPATAKVRLYYIGWSSSTGEADWALRPLFASESWAPKLNNVSFYKNELVDKSIARALVTTDEGERAALYKKTQEQIFKDLPRVPLVTEMNLAATSKRLSGVHVMPDGNINMDAIAVND